MDPSEKIRRTYNTVSFAYCEKKDSFRTERRLLFNLRSKRLDTVSFGYREGKPWVIRPLSWIHLTNHVAPYLYERSFARKDTILAEDPSGLVYGQLRKTFTLD